MAIQINWNAAGCKLRVLHKMIVAKFLRRYFIINFNPELC
jgi:hypothetical protein